MTQAQTDMNSPYQGLTPYTEADAPYFFGRTHEIATITASLEVARLTLFYGPSGVGKTSVLRAGVVCQLQDQARADLRRNSHAFISVYFNRWQSDPLTGLAQAVETAIAACDVRNVESSAKGEDVASSQNLPAFLRTQSERMDSDLLIILDQFEEYFLYHADERGPGTFGDAFVQAVNSIDLRANFLISLREDALARLDRFKGLIPFLLDHRLSIGHLRRAAGEEAVVKPLERFNRDEGTHYTVESALVTAVLDGVNGEGVTLSKQGAGGQGGRSAAETIEAPYLQLVLTRLWEEELANGSTQMRKATLEETLGGAATIVRNYLDNTLDALSAAERAQAARFVDRLVTPSGAKIALSFAHLARFAGEDQALLSTLLQQLQERRLLRGVPAPDGETQYEIFHDVLGPALLDWQARYQKTQDELARLDAEQSARADAERRAAEAAEHAQLEGEARRQAQLRAAAEQRNSRRLRWLLGLIGALLIGAVGLALFAFNAQTEALAQRNEAQRQAQVAATEQTKAELNAAEAKRQTQIALVHQLAAQSDAAMAISYPRSLLLAMAAMQASQSVTPTLPLAVAATALHARLEGQPGSTPLIGQASPVNAVAFSPDGKWLASASLDRTVRIWTIGAWGTQPILLRGHGSDVNAVAFSPDGKWLASASLDRTVRIWTVGAWETQPILLRGHEDAVNAVVFSPDGKWLASASSDQTVRIWAVGAWETLPILLRGHEADVRSVAFSPDGKWLASASDDKTVRIWAVGAWETQPILLRGHEADVLSVAFSPDGKWLASASVDNTVRIWAVGAWETQPILLRGHESAVWSVAFSPDGKWLASASYDNTLRIWAVGAWDAQPIILRGHEGYVSAVAFSADGKWLASASSDKTLRIWAVGAWDAQPIILRGHEGYVSAVAFSADGKWLASASSDNTVRAWTLPEAPLVAMACRLSGRNFTQAEWQQYFGAAAYQVTCPQWPRP